MTKHRIKSMNNMHRILSIFSDHSTLTFKSAKTMASTMIFIVLAYDIQSQRTSHLRWAYPTLNRLFAAFFRPDNKYLVIRPEDHAEDLVACVEYPNA